MSSLSTLTSAAVKLMRIGDKPLLIVDAGNLAAMPRALFGGLLPSGQINSIETWNNREDAVLYILSHKERPKICEMWQKKCRKDRRFQFK
jgi:hypothetical protein